MNEHSSHQESLETLARVLIRCFLGGAIFLLIWFISCVVARDSIYLLQSRWFGITREHFELVNYCGIAATKILIIVAFLIPYVSLRLVLKNRP
ncbi:MAG: DUF6868 family protein [Candidatus Hydrogenedentales bacterium]